MSSREQKIEELALEQEEAFRCPHCTRVIFNDE